MNVYEPKDECREVVRNLAKHGIPQNIIADTLDICEETLMKYYGKEWKEGKSHSVTEVAKKLYSKAIEGDNASIFFLLKTQANYKETNVVQNQYTDTNGKDLHTKDKEILENAGIKQD